MYKSEMTAVWLKCFTSSLHEHITNLCICSRTRVISETTLLHQPWLAGGIWTARLRRQNLNKSLDASTWLLHHRSYRQAPCFTIKLNLAPEQNGAPNLAAEQEEIRSSAALLGLSSHISITPPLPMRIWTSDTKTNGLSLTLCPRRSTLMDHTQLARWKWIFCRMLSSLS